MPKSKEVLTYNIIGFGDGGISNARCLQILKNTRVIAVCDPNPETLTLAKSVISDVKTYHTHMEMLKKSPAKITIIAAPDPDHYRPTKDVLEAGSIAVVEKPIAESLTDLNGFTALAEQYPHKIISSEKYYFADPIQALVLHKNTLGELVDGSTSYTMRDCDRIMGGGKWRTEHAYNPVLGGLIHNFMVLIGITGQLITKICCTSAQVQTYKELEQHSGYDTMKGTLELKNGTTLNWDVNLGTRGRYSRYGHRTVTYDLQFESGALVYARDPRHDQLIGHDGKSISFKPELDEHWWSYYNIHTLYKRMHESIQKAIREDAPQLYSIKQCINAARACIYTFTSIQNEGSWQNVL